MTSLNVAVVSRDPSVRLAAARAFDHAPSSWKVRLHDATPRDADVVVFGADLRDQARGQILFDPAARADVIEEVRRCVAAARCKAFVVTGAGRGVGVTSLALHLAAAAARANSTCFIDLDLDWGAAHRFGIDGGHRSWSDVADEEDELKLAALPVAGGFRALLAPTPSWVSRFTQEQDEPAVEGHVEATGRSLRVARPPDAVNRSSGPGAHEPARSAPSLDTVRAAGPRMRDLLRVAGKVFERVVIDCPELRLVDLVLDQVDAAVLVMSPTMPAARRAAAVLERRETARWAVVLNRMGPGGETTRAELHRVLERRTAVELPCTPSLRDAEDDGRLLTSSWTSYVRRTDRLLRALEVAS